MRKPNNDDRTTMPQIPGQALSRVQVGAGQGPRRGRGTGPSKKKGPRAGRGKGEAEAIRAAAAAAERLLELPQESPEQRAWLYGGGAPRAVALEAAGEERGYVQCAGANVGPGLLLGLSLGGLVLWGLGRRGLPVR